MYSPQKQYSDSFWAKLGKFIGLLVALSIPQLVLFLPIYNKNIKLAPSLSWTLFAGSYFLLYVLYMWFYRKYRTETPQKLDRSAWTYVAIGWIIMIFAKIVFGMLNIVVSHQQTTANDADLQKILGNSDSTIVIMTIMMIVFFGPLAEELLFRGILMNFFFKNHFWPSVLLSGLLFGLSHSNTTWTGSLIYIALGLILAFIYKKTNNLKITIILHFLNNLPAILLLFANLSGK
ncbi:lysostaphin resistance A-like protein [Agrilactobacillus fermenti]|uniref:CPBP family intramembrane glutamic endopeptidase n=1 Tax=Agrilactobacillus fermenti TaxID=2586909 RepID=UPI001E4F4FEC|nr:type II CAAX endopeptidase family protein [Agrilactobacillus fermenti]MCD2256153.1 CPBP family intramembrane metalloprotease [Agrilactobacillus fermenti]